ncbi:hypothetical protein [Gallibacterium anatis]|uniref:YubB ferredoxin-like domain-containing protein n=1 Tax=Gallibacterium anatis TaxID=750 RepID=A0A1A7P8U5_9PAST|nr:hypothetical protein [Gallibacterium anatis]OBW94248.1 hypothetical protein QV02_08215 [Gallibacterium anatis]OBW98240.1 hypothetical protein QV03_07580 [Gallibacterium anatis]
MPNWCENRLDIIANTADELKTVLEKVIRINDHNEEGYQYNDFILDFELLLPMPKELNIEANFLPSSQYLANIEKFGVGNWYEWHCKYWGVKWNANTQYCPDYDINDTELSIDFDTPWCAPEAWFKTLIDTFPNVTFKLTYFEPGMFFAGICSSVESENCYYQYPESTSEVKILAKEFGYEDEDWHCDNE